MRDLYSDLGIDPGASEQEVTAAVGIRPDLAAHSSILLNRERRVAYDRTLLTLKTIGALRSRLGLGADDGLLENVPDHAPGRRPERPPPIPAANAGAATRMPTSQAAANGGARSQPSAVRPLSVLVLVLVAAVAFAVVAFKLL